MMRKSQTEIEIPRIEIKVRSFLGLFYLLDSSFQVFACLFYLFLFSFQYLKCLF